MKAKLWITMAMFVGLMASCETTNNDPVINYENTASHDIAGTYSGVWTVIDGNGNETTPKGTITFAEKEDAYVATITVTCEGAADRTDVCNVSHANHGFVFYNNTGASFGTKFSGSIDADGNISMQYAIEERQGRFTVTNSYSFSGVRQ